MFSNWIFYVLKENNLKDFTLLPATISLFLLAFRKVEFVHYYACVSRKDGTCGAVN